MAWHEPLHEAREWQELSRGQRVARFALCYLAWAGFVGVGIVCANLILQILWGFLPLWGPWTMRGVNSVAPILIVMLLLAYVLFMEYYLRRGVVTNRLRPRLVRSALWVLPIAALLYLTSVLVPRLLGVG